MNVNVQIVWIKEARKNSLLHNNVQFGCGVKIFFTLRITTIIPHKILLHHYTITMTVFSKNKEVGSSLHQPLSLCCNTQMILDVSQSLHPHKHLGELAVMLVGL